MNELTTLLTAQHNKKDFSCGKIMLEDYLQKQANRDIKRKLTACFVLEDKATGRLKGYYTLANNSINQESIPLHFQKKLPKSYYSLPTTLIGRLAIDYRFQGKGIGQLLLIDALKRSFELSKSMGSFAVIVDPIDDEAEVFYTKFGFIKLPDSGKLFLPMVTIKSLFESNL